MKKFILVFIVAISFLAGCKGDRTKGSQFSCSDKYFVINDRKYCAYRISASWRDAQKRCETTGSHLAVIRSQHEMEAMREILCSSWGYADGLWIGLNDIKIENVWAWVSGDPVRYGNWRDGQPENRKWSEKEDEDCVEWLPDNGTWNDLACSHNRGYLCMSGGKETHAFRCSGKLFAYGEYQFCAYRKAVDWHSARKACEDNGGRIATISTPEMNAVIKKHLGLPWEFYGNLWIGLSDIEQEGNFQWITKEDVRYGNWCPGEPNNAGDSGEDCVHLYTSTGCWNDLPCDFRNGFICESD